MNESMVSQEIQNKKSLHFLILPVMKVLLDIKDNKALHLLEVLKSLPYVRTKQLTGEKALLLEEIREAAEEMKLIQEGKKQARNAEDFLNEL